MSRDLKQVKLQTVGLSGSESEQRARPGASADRPSRLGGNFA